MDAPPGPGPGSASELGPVDHLSQLAVIPLLLRHRKVARDVRFQALQLVLAPAVPVGVARCREVVEPSGNSGEQNVFVDPPPPLHHGQVPPGLVARRAERERRRRLASVDDLDRVFEVELRRGACRDGGLKISGLRARDLQGLHQPRLLEDALPPLGLQEAGRDDPALDHRGHG